MSGERPKEDRATCFSAHASRAGGRDARHVESLGPRPCHAAEPADPVRAPRRQESTSAFSATGHRDVQ